MAAKKPSVGADMDTRCVSHVEEAEVQPSFGKNERTSQRETVVKILIKRQIILVIQQHVPIYRRWLETDTFYLDAKIQIDQPNPGRCQQKADKHQ